MKVGWMLAATLAAEAQLAERLRAVAERHAAEAEVFHVANRLAGLSERSAAAAREHLERHGGPAAVAAPPSPLPPDGADPHVGLLRDLRHLHVLATGVVLDWTALGQAAAAARDGDLAALTEAATKDATRTVKWTTTMLKTGAAQALLS